MKKNILNITLFKPILLGILIGMLSLSGVNLSAAEYYIAKNGNDNFSGSISKPWRSIQKANDSLVAGDTVYIRQGVYDEIIRPVNTGLVKQRITYKNYLSETAIIRGVSPDKPVVAIYYSYITIDGLDIKLANPQGQTKSRNIIVSGTSAKYNEILNCKIINRTDPVYESQTKKVFEFGIDIQGAFGTLIEGNIIKGLSGQGVKLQGKPKLTVIRGNTITGNYGDSIRIDSSEGELQGTLIEDNKLGGSLTSDGIQTNNTWTLSAALFSSTTENRGIVIRNNIIYDNAENAIDLKGAANVVIEKNIIYGTQGNNDGFVGDGLNDRNSINSIGHGKNQMSKNVIIRQNIIYDNASGIKIDDGSIIYNNTIVGNNRDYTGSNSIWSPAKKPGFVGIKSSARFNNSSVKNNIIGDHNGGEISIHEKSSLQIGGNIYFKSSTNNMPSLSVFRRDYDWDKLTVDQWVAKLQALSNIVGNDQSVSLVTPLFNKLSLKPMASHFDGNFKLTFNSPAIDKGVPLTLTKGSGSGKVIGIVDARYFYDGYGVTSGDVVKIGNNGLVEIINVDYVNNKITVNKNITWADSSWVTLPYKNNAPDVGAYEFKSFTATVPLKPTGLVFGG